MKLLPARFTHGCTLIAALALAGPSAAADWLKLTAPGFTVISEASESKTRSWAAEFELFHRGIAHFLPTDPTRLQPVTIVLFGSARRFNPYKPLENGKPARIEGLFIRMPGRNILATSIDGARDDTRERIYHEATHWYLNAFDRELPLWLEEGLAEVFGTFTLQGPSFRVGSPRPGYTRYVQVAEPMPFAQLMTVRAGGLSYGQHADQTDLFYAQSWAMAHFVMFAEGLPGLPKLQTYLQQPDGDAEPMDEIARAFGRTPAEFDKQLLAYLDNRKLTYFSAPLDRAAAEAGFALRAASAAEVDLALGNLLLGVHRPADAEAFFWRADSAPSTSPEARVGLGEVELAKGNVPEALAQFKEAFARGGSSFVGYFLAATAGLRELQGGPRFTEPSASEFHPSVTNLVHALELDPRFVPGYELMGLIASWSSGADIPAVETTLREGLRRYPRRPEIHLGLGFIEARLAHIDQAREHCRRATEGVGRASFPIKEGVDRLSQRIDRLAPSILSPPAFLVPRQPAPVVTPTKP